MDTILHREWPADPARTDSDLREVLGAVTGKRLIAWQLIEASVLALQFEDGTTLVLEPVGYDNPNLAGFIASDVRPPS